MEYVVQLEKLKEKAGEREGIQTEWMSRPGRMFIWLEVERSRLVWELLTRSDQLKHCSRDFVAS